MQIKNIKKKIGKITRRRTSLTFGPINKRMLTVTFILYRGGGQNLFFINVLLFNLTHFN